MSNGRAPLPPHNLEAERSALGAVLLDQGHLAALRDEQLHPEHFYREQHGAVYAAMIELHQSGRKIDHLTVAETLRHNGRLEQAGGPAAVEELAGWAPAAGHAREYARIVHDDALRRTLLTATYEMQAQAADHRGAVRDTIDRARSTLDELARQAGPRRRYEFASFAEFDARQLPDATPLLGKPGKILLAAGSLLMVYGADGAAKSTWTIDGVVHLAAGLDWLGHPVLRPVRVCIIENEGPPSLFQQKLRDKLAAWQGPDPRPNLFVYADPWGAFSFADPDARRALRAYCLEQRIDLVTANPTLGLGVGTSGRPDETQRFVDWLVECGLWRDLAFWLTHHENKQGQISGDWGRQPDMKVWLQRDGNRQRTKLTWDKPRWATLDPDEKAVMLEWVTESWGYKVVPLDAVGATDDELDERIREFLAASPASSTAAVQAGVKGTNARITARLKAGFDSAPGPRGAVLWLPPATSTSTCRDELDEVA